MTSSERSQPNSQAVKSVCRDTPSFERPEDGRIRGVLYFSLNLTISAHSQLQRHPLEKVCVRMSLTLINQTTNASPLGIQKFFFFSSLTPFN